MILSLLILFWWTYLLLANPDDQYFIEQKLLEINIKLTKQEYSFVHSKIRSLFTLYIYIAREFYFIWKNKFTFIKRKKIESNTLLVNQNHTTFCKNDKSILTSPARNETIFI